MATATNKKQDTVEVFKINEPNRKNIKKLLREASQKEDRALDYLDQAKHRYDNVLVILQESGVEWGKITVTIQTEVFKAEWPIKDTGRPMGLTNLLKEQPEFAPAIWLNRFNAYRSDTYTDYGVPKIKAERPKPSEMSPEELEQYELRLGQERTKARISTAHVINRQLVRKDILEIFTYATKTANQQAAELARQLFAVLFGDTGETVHEIPEPVESPIGEIFMPVKEESDEAEEE